ncbi:MAG: hypothetical protein ACJAWW_000846 [Sulfurimonas sp.]|jgi:hypothetical protein
MKNLVLILLSLFILTGCVSSSLNLNKDKELVLKYNKSDLLLTNKVIDSSFLNFKDLFVTIYKLEDKEGRVLFYEDARTEENFEFTYSGLYTVMYVFDDRQKYNILYKRNNIQLVQFKLKDEKYLNVMIQASDSQRYSFAYGFSNKEFLEIANIIKVKGNDTIGKLEHEGLVLDSSSKALSNWNAELVFFKPLISTFSTIGEF